jgi:hypothetical protein
MEVGLREAVFSGQVREVFMWAAAKWGVICVDVVV